MSQQVRLRRRTGGQLLQCVGELFLPYVSWIYGEAHGFLWKPSWHSSAVEWCQSESSLYRRHQCDYEKLLKLFRQTTANVWPEMFSLYLLESKFIAFQCGTEKLLDSSDQRTISNENALCARIKENAILRSLTFQCFLQLFPKKSIEWRISFFLIFW